MGHPGEADFHFCGEQVNPGYPYCVDHCGRAFQAQFAVAAPAARRRRRRSGGRGSGKHVAIRVKFANKGGTACLRRQLC